MLKKQFLLIILSFFACNAIMLAQRDTLVIINDIPKTYNVFEIIQSDNSGGTTIKIYQDKRIESLFMDRQLQNNTATITGYRVQVFSSNAQRSAKENAFYTEQLVTQKFPHRGVYVTYNSPFWKVRVGDFRTLEEAREFRNELMKAFPELKNEMYVVRDEISTIGFK